VEVQEEMATGVTAFAVAVPLFVTASVAVKDWPVSTVVLLGVSVAFNAPAAWTVTGALADAETVAASFASLPLAEALRVSVPEAEVKQPP
jgi:hypothetical protein